MDNVTALAILALAAICFGSGFVLGSAVNDHWKIVEHDNCMATVRVEVPQRPAPCPGCTVGKQFSYEDARRLALSGAFQQLQRCDALAGLATLENLTGGRLDDIINGR